MNRDDKPNQTWVFDRYVNGVLMAEGVEVTRASSIEKAMATAARLAARGPNGETPVLVSRTAIDALARLEDAEAAQALLVERAAGVCTHFGDGAIKEADDQDVGEAGRKALGIVSDTAFAIRDAIRALASPSGVEALAALRAERDVFRVEMDRLQTKAMDAVDAARTAEAERDDALTRLAAAEAQRDRAIELAEKAQAREAVLMKAARPFLDTPVLADGRAMIRAVDRLRAALATVTPPAIEPDCPDCGLPHPSRNPYCFCSRPPADTTEGRT